MKNDFFVFFLVKRAKRLFSQRLILKNIVLKELKTRYAGSLLGISWAIITPLLIMIVVNFVFTNVMKINIDRFPLFVLSAILPWMAFSVSVFDAAFSITNNVSLLNQFSLPREILPVSSVTANFMNFLLGLIAVLPAFIISDLRVINFIQFLPLVILLHFIFTIGTGLLLSCLNVFFRDIIHLLEVGLMFWLWATPVFYSLNMVPAGFRWLYVFNPMAVYITMYRNILFEARMPEMHSVSMAAVMALFMLAIGYFVFVKHEEAFLKKI